jgi:hypothetical protein
MPGRWAGGATTFGFDCALNCASFSARSGLQEGGVTSEAPARAGIDEFVERTKPLLEKMRRLHERRLLGIFPYKITDEFASELIKSCFYASMISDEGRWPLLTVGVCGADPKQPIAALDPPVPADPTAIAKLAHTVNDWCSLGVADVNGRPTVVGVLPSMSVRTGTFVTQSVKTFSALKVVIRGPGNLDVVCEEGVLTYKAGVVSQYESILSSKVLERLAAVMDGQVTILLGEDFRSKVDEGIEQRLANVSNPEIARLLRESMKAQVPADSKAQLVLSELVFRISEMRHGGILIVTSRPETPVLSYKYRTKTGRLQNAVVRYWRAAHEDGHGTSRVSPSQSPGPGLVHEGILLRECVAATAQLAGTDGAVVLGPDFSLLGFGAIIDKAAVDESSVKFIDGADGTITYGSILANKGSRHQSALSFVMREEGSAVFVISQDGHVTVLENQGGVVRCERGLRAEGL